MTTSKGYNSIVIDGGRRMKSLWLKIGLTLDNWVQPAVR